MDYQKMCVKIFGTDNIKGLTEIADKARKYDLIYSKDQVLNQRGAGRKPGIDCEQAKNMQDLYTEGVSAAEIAKKYNVTRQTVYRYINAKKKWKEDRSITLHIDYMYEDEVCSVINVDFKNQKVYVENKTDKIILTAFGVNRKPSWEEFMEFLESRCFPRSRCQVKRILKESGLDSYDPLQIIEKTQGRMAEDHHWLKIEYKHCGELT